MEFKEGVFDLSPDDLKVSKMIYGKTVKCLVAPYHSYAQLEKVIPYTETTLLFPERDLSASKITGLISMISNSDKDNYLIVTSNMSIILDMAGECVRVLTESGEIVNTKTKTFAANIHTIRYELLENKSHRTSDNEKSAAVNKINDLIDRIENLTPGVTKAAGKLLKEIRLVGEPIIQKKLEEMLMDIVDTGTN